jgi:integrase
MKSREEMLPAEPKIETFLSDLAVRGQVAVSTQNQAFNALLFVYREVLHIQLGNIDSVRATRPVRVPTVLTPEEARRIIQLMSGSPQLVVKLIYGGGLRLLEALRLRVQDLDFEMKQLTVRDGKGAKDRYTMLPEAVMPALREHLERVHLTHQQDLAKGYGAVYLPGALDRKYPNAARLGAGPESVERQSVERRAIRFVIASPLRCCSAGRISERSRSCWGTTTSPPP